MSTLVETPLPARMALATFPTEKPGHILLAEVPKPSKEINLLLAVQRPVVDSAGAPAYQYDTIQALPADTIKDVKLRLKNKGWYSAKHCLVFGDRELLEHEVIGQIASTSSSMYLHVFVRFSDIDAVNVVTLKRELSFQNLPDVSDHPKSALTASLANLADAHDLSVATRQPSLELVANKLDNTIIHLMVRKSAKVNWRHVGDDKFELTISSLDTVDTLKRKIEAVNWDFEAEKHNVVFSGQVLKGGKPLSSYGIGKGSVVELVPLSPPNASSVLEGSPLLSSPAHGLYDNWQKARAGLAEGHFPKLAKAGSGGSYFLSDVHGESVAVFKPEDEEPMAVNNPRGLASSPTGEGLRKGLRPGEGAAREVAAYILDHGHFSGVPPTAFVSLKGTEAVKVGSLQQFVRADSDCEERGPSLFPVSEVHKICVLDLRLANTDRNGGNILARKVGSSWELIPIDHGYCLPDTFEDLNFEWMYWAQARIPFDADTLKYVSALDADKDLALLDSQGVKLRPACVRVFKVCTTLLKKAAARGLSPYQIGCICSRQSATKSPLEKLHQNALHLAGTRRMGVSPKPTLSKGFKAADDEVYFENMSKLIDEYLDDFALDVDDDLW